MNLILLLPFLAVLLGISGGVLRGLSLLNGYEPQTHLPVSGDNFQFILIVLTVISAAVFILLCAKVNFSTELKFEKAFMSSSPAYKTFCVISSLILILCGIGGFISTLQTASGFYSYVTDFPLWVLSMLTGVSIICLARLNENITESSAFFTIIPMFWAAFDLIVIFKSNSSSPFVSYYSFELMPSIFLALAFYAFAAFLYSKPKPKFMLAASSLAIFFSLSCAVGTFMAHIINPSLWAFGMQTLLHLGCIIGASIYLFVLNLNLCKNIL